MGRGVSPLPLATLAGVLPEQFELGANYPNPFNPSTMIPYQLPTAMYVRLEVFNILGQRVATLVDGEQPAGFHTASWDATDEAGQAVGAGVYLYRLSGAGVQATRSMLLIDGQAGLSRARPAGATPAEEEAGEKAPVYGLTVSGPGLIPYLDPAFRVEAGMPPLDLVVEAPGSDPSAKATLLGRDPRRRRQHRGCGFLRRPAGGPVQPGRPPSSCPTTATSLWGTSTPTGRWI